MKKEIVESTPSSIEMDAAWELMEIRESWAQDAYKDLENFMKMENPDLDELQELYDDVRRTFSRYREAVVVFFNVPSEDSVEVDPQAQTVADNCDWRVRCLQLCKIAERRLLSRSRAPKTVGAVAADAPPTTDCQEEDKKIDEAAAAVDEPSCDNDVTITPEQTPVVAAAGPKLNERGETETPTDENPEPERAEGFKMKILPAESKEDKEVGGETESPSQAEEIVPAPEESHNRKKTKTTKVVFQYHIAKDDVRGTHPVEMSTVGTPHPPSLVKVNMKTDLERQRKLSHQDSIKMTTGGLTPKKLSYEGTPLQPCRIMTKKRPPLAPPWGELGTWTTKIAVPIRGY